MLWASVIARREHLPIEEATLDITVHFHRYNVLTLA